MKDKNGTEIKLNDQVLVPEPNDDDIHNKSFVGNATDLFEELGIVVVEDQDSDFFEIEAERLEVVK